VADCQIEPIIESLKL